MLTYNNQWAPARARWRRRVRAAVKAALGQLPPPPCPEPQELPPRRARKHPRWIDRDT